MAASVEFLQKMKDFQDINYTSENKRLQLEKELNYYVKSDARMARLKAVRLQNYWKKICEDEKRSQWRNEQLLQDFDRVDSHMAELGARTERLRVMKKQYEEYIERTYPQWKEKVIFMKQQREELEKRARKTELMKGEYEPVLGQFDIPPSFADYAEPHSHGHERVDVTAGLLTGLGNHGKIQPEALGYTGPPMVTQEQPNFGSLQYAANAGRSEQPQQDVRSQELEVNQEPVGQTPQQNDVHMAHSMDNYRYEMSPGQIPQSMDHMSPFTSSTLQTTTSPRTGTNLSSVQACALITGNQNVDSSGTQAKSSPVVESAIGQICRSTNEIVQHNHSSMLQTIESDDTEESVNSPKQVTVSTVKALPEQVQESTTVLNATGEYVDTGITDPNSTLSQTCDGSDNFKKESSIRLDNKNSLPLSPRVVAQRQHQTGARKVSSPRRGSSPGIRSRKNSQSSILGDKSEDRSIYPKADITLEGLCNLIDAIQGVLATSRQQKLFYRTDLPPASVRDDIIENCNKDQMLTHVDPTSISMVVLEQLPLVLQNCAGGTLLSDDYLGDINHSTDCDTVRLNIHTTSVWFWDLLCEHFRNLIQYSIMDGAEIGEIFGPQLIGEDSPYEDKASALLVDMLDGVEPVDRTSLNSTENLSSMLTPKTLPRPIPNEEVPPLELPVSKSEDDNISKKGQINQGESLTQSAAYRQLLGMGISPIKSGDYEDSDESDEIEKVLTSPEPKFSTGIAASVLPKSQGEPPVTSSPRSRDQSVASSVNMSPPLSLTSPRPYVPSVLASTGKSAGTLSSTGLNTSKKPGFNFGDSDTDEDVVLAATGAGAKDSELEDDFNFYS